MAFVKGRVYICLNFYDPSNFLVVRLAGVH